MAATITINLASGTTGKLYADASSSSNYMTYSTQPGSTITIECRYEGASKATVTLKETSDGTQIANCPMILVDWDHGGRQAVLFSSTTSGKPMAQWKSGSSTISYSPITVNSGGTITVTAVAASGAVDTTAPSDVGIAGYYYAHNGRGGRYNYSNGTYSYEEYTTADTQQGIRSKPARCGNGVPVDVSFKYNGTAKYFIYMMMRGWSGSSAGCPGDMGMLAGSGPIVNSTFKTSWGSGYDEYRMDVFALSASGIYPSLDGMPGDGTSVTSCPSNSTWIKWPADSSLSTHSVKYYATNGTTLLRSNTEAKLDLDFEKVTGSAITFYKGTELYKYLSGDSGTLVIPSGKRFKGWQKKEGSGSYGNVITTASGLGKVGSSDVSLKLVIEDDNVDITFNANGGTVGGSATTTKSWLIGSTQTLLTPTAYTKNGYTVTFAGWYTSASGGTKVGDAGASYTVPSSGKTFYAHWTETANSYIISFDTNLGETPTSSMPVPDHFESQELTFGQPYGSIIPSVSRYGYTPDNQSVSNIWYDAPVGGNNITPESIFNYPGDQTLYAHWEPIENQIIFESSIPEVTLPSNLTFTFEDFPDLEIYDVAEKEGFTFIGWVRNDGDVPTLPYVISAWEDNNIILKARFQLKLSTFTPNPGYPGYDTDHPDDDNDCYGIPVDSLDSNSNYRLILSVEGDRKNGTHGEPDGQGDVFTMPSGTGVITRKSDNSWVWTYDTDIVLGSYLKKLEKDHEDDESEPEPFMRTIIFTMDVWRVQVYNSSATLKVELKTYEGETEIGSDSTENEFVIGDEYIPYASPLDKGLESDVLLFEGVDSIRALDLYNSIGTSQQLIDAGSYENIKDRIYTRRFIGNGKSTVMVKVRARSQDPDGKELLYGAVPRYVIVKLDDNGVGNYDSGYKHAKLENVLPTDDPNHQYDCDPIVVDRLPFPNLMHNNEQDFVNARFRILVLDSRHYVEI